MTQQPQDNSICTDCDEPFYDALGYSICEHCRRCDAIEQRREEARANRVDGYDHDDLGESRDY